MDIFIEKLVTRKKTLNDYLIVAALALAGCIAAVAVASLRVLQAYSFLFVAGIIYLTYFFAKTRNIEYEYAITNGELDIDKIVSQRKRTRVFSSICKEFEVVAKVKSEYFKGEYKDIKNIIEACSSVEADDLYFIVLNYKGMRTLVYFEPDDRMLNAFKTFIPRKVFI